MLVGQLLKGDRIELGAVIVARDNLGGGNAANLLIAVHGRILCDGKFKMDL
jgi:hypothetical protein